MLSQASVIILAVKVSELGEFGLINLIHGDISRYVDSRRTPWRELVVGIGDDAAAWQSNNHIQLATTDTLVQDIHFNLDVINWEELGWKALAVNLSDMAAMGGVPKYALLALALPGELEVEDILKFTSGLLHLAKKLRVAIVGGNVATAPNVVITVTIIGCSEGRVILRRSTASPGDQIAVTGYLGSSAAALEMFKGKTILDPRLRNVLRQAHFKPMPKTKEGRLLVKQGVKTATDISDGLIADLDHICESSRVNAKIKIEQVPVHPGVIENFLNYQELALSGGEDYELLFTADEVAINRVKQTLNCPVTVIGDIIEEKSPTRVTVVDSTENIIPYKKAGWEHFKYGVSEAKFA